MTVTLKMLQDQPEAGLSSWADALEARGCLAPGGGEKLASQVVESLPLDPTLAFRLLHSNDRISGQVDLGPQIRLQVVSPLESVAPDDPITEIEGNSNNNSLNVTVKTSAHLRGYETALYGIRPKANRPGFDILPLFADQHIGGETEHRRQPTTDYLRFPPEAAFYRLFYKAGQTDFTALVVAAPTRPELDRRTRLLDTDNASCAKVDRELCIEMPRGIAINPLLAITVNGAEAQVGWGATVGGAIRGSGQAQPEAVLPTLAVSRLYNGQPVRIDFDRSDAAILRLPLSGGEVISWKQ